MVVKSSASTNITNKHEPVAHHPSWQDMIKECILAHPENARTGVSRPVIKKFIESKYQVAITPASSSHLAKAIAHGVEKGTFVLPKGAAGKVKLAHHVQLIHSGPNETSTSRPHVATDKPASKGKKPASHSKKQAVVAPASPAKKVRGKPATRITVTKAKASTVVARKAAPRKLTSAKRGTVVKKKKRLEKIFNTSTHGVKVAARVAAIKARITKTVSKSNATLRSRTKKATTK